MPSVKTDGHKFRRTSMSAERTSRRVLRKYELGREYDYPFSVSE